MALFLREMGMGSQNQNKHLDYREYNRPYAAVTDEGLQFYFRSYRRRWMRELDRGYKTTLAWHIRAIITEIKLRGGNVDRE
jgi:hypothetical protein